MGAEFVLVFFSVVLAFVADDWRTSRDETRAAEASLQLVLRDLGQDLTGLERLRDALVAQDAAALRLLSAVESDAPREQLAEAADRAFSQMVFRPSYAAYQGLQQTGRLWLLPDPELRDALVSHYDETLIYLERLRTQEEDAALRAVELGERHFRWIPVDPPKVNAIVATSSAAEIRRDKDFLGALAYLGGRRRWLGYRVGGGAPDDLFGYPGNFITRTERLMREVESHLGDGS